MLKGKIGEDFTNKQPEPPQQDINNFEINIPAPAQYKIDWETYKVINIKNLYPELQANALWDYYFNSPELFKTIIHPDPYFNYTGGTGTIQGEGVMGDDGYFHLPTFEDDDPTLPARIKYAHEVRNNDGFSYFYKRTEVLHPYLNIFFSNKFIKLLEFITGHNNLTIIPENTFVSCYESGHYNGRHTDGMNGRIAFVFHISQDWNVWDGGLFMGMDWDWKTITKVVVPPFNTLTMFDVSNGMPHYVSEVAQNCDNKRISFTGWYQ